MNIDWPRVLAEIAWHNAAPVPGFPSLRAPIGPRVLGEFLGVSRGAIRNWMDGAEPRWSDGQRVLDAWCLATGAHRDDVPVIATTLSAFQVKATIAR